MSEARGTLRDRIIDLARRWDEESVEPAEDFADALLELLDQDYEPSSQDYEPRWTAGPVAPCGGGTCHRVAAVHIIARCACGYASMSTDGSIAFNRAQRHDPSAAVGSA